MERFNLCKILCIFWVKYFLGIHRITFATPEHNLRIDYIKVHSEIKLRFAKSRISGLVTNPTNRSEAVMIKLIIPERTFLSDFKLEIDGSLYIGQIKQKDYASYQGVDQGQRSSHRAYDDSDAFDFMVNVPEQTEMKFSLNCQKLLHRVQGRYSFSFSFMTSHKINEYEIQVEIEETRNISYLAVNNRTEFEDGISMMFSKPSQALIRHQEKPMTTNLRTFTVEYDLERSFDLGDIVISGEYFVHYFAPILESEIPKVLLFILDKSGSMGGKRLQSLKFAMHRILGDLGQADEFGIIAFESGVDYMSQELLDASFGNVNQARGFIDDITAGGGTDIKSALLNGLSFLNAGMNRDRGTKMIFFLTDGALFGVKKTALMEIKYANIYDIPIYSIAFGEDADSEFLQHLSRQNHGESRRVNDSNEAVNDITDLFQDIPETMLRNLTFWYPFYKQAVTSQTSFKTYLNGTEISVAGYIEKHSKNNSVDVDVDFEADQNENITNIKKYMVLKPDDKFCPDDYICLPAYMQEFVENTMVHKKILEMIAEINNKKQNSHAAKLLMKKIIFMSMKYGLVTPYTDLHLPDSGLKDKTLQFNHETSEEMDAFEMLSPEETNGTKRITKVQDFTINIAIISTSQLNRHRQNKTYIGEIFISSIKFNLLVTPLQLFVNGRQLQWSNVRERFPLYGNSYLPGCIEYHGPRSVKLTICRRLRKDGHLIDYLNIAISNLRRREETMGGFLGQAYKWPIKLIRTTETERGVVGKFVIIKPDHRMHFRAKLKHRKIPTEFAFAECWEMHRSIETLFTEPIKLFIKSTLLVV
ncbi:inter-alpha-trypsin inhibitor heavy chain H5-like isoform X2 [Ostrea edulis]|uniref:inter-alpha-trypsin inhibitor heavy chain H5-like isoform X2 n=1 Tax=Ostrea edulis TaxID=37623 RepID=UPI0024AF48CA|nr:inter-alpha-trypsin inhibitor heavy chain H5-like isoform X2 [Ostrea edulis]